MLNIRFNARLLESMGGGELRAWALLGGREQICCLREVPGLV